MITTPDWRAERAQFPACTNTTYLMSASTGPMPNDVLAAYTQQLSLLNRRGGLHVAEAVALITNLRQAVAALVDAESSADTAMVANTSLAMNIIALMLKGDALLTKPVLMAEEEFPSTSMPFHHLGFQVHRVPASTLRETLAKSGSKFGAVICSAVQFGAGYRQNLVELGELAEVARIPFIVNATQALGGFPISVRDAKVSALVGSAHKWLCAGYGLSVFFASAAFRKDYKWPLAGWLSVENPSLMSSGPQPLTKDCGALILGTLPYPQVAGLEVAIKRVLRIGGPAIAKRLLYLSDYFTQSLLQAFPTAELVSSRDQNKEWTTSCNSGIVSVRAKDADKLAQALEADNIFVTARRGALRVSPHYFNDESDIMTLIGGLKRYQSDFT